MHSLLSTPCTVPCASVTAFCAGDWACVLCAVQMIARKRGEEIES
jgi:hypothetical protein